jgi:hypothetical protein
MIWFFKYIIVVYPICYIVYVVRLYCNLIFFRYFFVFFFRLKRSLWVVTWSWQIHREPNLGVSCFYLFYLQSDSCTMSSISVEPLYSTFRPTWLLGHFLDSFWSFEAVFDLLEIHVTAPENEKETTPSLA